MFPNSFRDENKRGIKNLSSTLFKDNATVKKHTLVRNYTTSHYSMDLASCLLPGNLIYIRHKCQSGHERIYVRMLNDGRTACKTSKYLGSLACGLLCGVKHAQSRLDQDKIIWFDAADILYIPLHWKENTNLLVPR